MYTDKMRRILNVLYLFGKMPSGGGHVKAPEIVFYSGYPTATTYRYISKMKKLGFMEQVKYRERRTRSVMEYVITNKGLEYLHGTLPLS